MPPLEEQRRVHAGGSHYADIFAVSRNARTAAGGRKHGGKAVAEECTAHIRIEITASHGGNSLDVTEVSPTRMITTGAISVMAERRREFQIAAFRTKQLRISWRS